MLANLEDLSLSKEALAALAQQLTAAHHLARKKQDKWSSYYESGEICACVQTLFNDDKTIVLVVPARDRSAYYMAHGFSDLKTILDILERAGIPKAFATNVFVSLFTSHLPKISNPAIHGTIIRGYKLSEAAEDPFAPFMALWYDHTRQPPPADMFYVDFETTAAPTSTACMVFAVPRDPVAVFGEMWETVRAREPVQPVTEQEITADIGPYLGRRDRCNVCGVVRTDHSMLKCCGRCKRVYYCSKECQTRHWPEHKCMCRAMRRS